MVSRNFCSGVKPHGSPRNSTHTDQRLHTEKPMCSEKIERIRFRRATRAPVASQNAVSSGRQSVMRRFSSRTASSATSVGVRVVTAVGGMQASVLDRVGSVATYEGPVARPLPPRVGSETVGARRFAGRVRSPVTDPVATVL